MTEPILAHSPAPSATADHRAALGDGWWLWRCFALRSAGFAQGLVLELASPESATAADTVVGLEETLGALQDDAVRRLDDVLESCRREGNVQRARDVKRIRRIVRRGRFETQLNADDVPGLEALRDLQRRVVEKTLEFETTFSLAREQTSQRLRRVAENELFREAMTWQNHGAIATCIEPLLRHEGPRTSQSRQHEECVAGYLQRYCVKNDTIGFFGPVAWGRLCDDGPPAVLDAGPSFLATRQVYFEQWAIERIAATLSMDARIRPWIPIRRHPAARLEGRFVRVADRPPLELTSEEQRVFAAVDGVRPAARLIADLAASRSQEDAQRILSVLRSFAQQGLISARLDLPIDPYPDRRLRERIQAIGHPPARRHAMRVLDELERLRHGIAIAAGRSNALCEALACLDAYFTKVTGAAPSRAPGAGIWGRTLVFEDCRRDVAMRLGPQTLEALGPPLKLVLTSARWLTHAVAEHYRPALRELYGRLARERSANSVDFVDFYSRCMAFMMRDGNVGRFVRSFRARWSQLLNVPPSANAVRLSSAALRPRVLKAFPAPAPGWLGGCHHSPDIMIAAANMDELAAGRCTYVLGELHIASNTLRGQPFVQQHPNPVEIDDGLDRDMPGLRLTPITPRRYAGRATRLFPKSNANGQYVAATTLDSIPPFQGKTLAGASLFVTTSGDQLVVRSLEDGLEFDFLQSLSGVLTAIVVDAFAIGPIAPHSPRISFDNLIVQRETWRMTPSAARFTQSATASRRFLEARNWRRSLGMPQHVFAKIPGEERPLYVNFESPIGIDIFARTLRAHPNAPYLTITEMLPAYDQTWLCDAAGGPYTSELRFVAVDAAS